MQEPELSILRQSAELAAPPPPPAGRRELPRGEATFLFTDIEGSTWLVQKLGRVWDTVLEDHYRILRGVWTAHDGYEMSTEGDAFFVVFARPHDAVAAAVDAQRALSGHGWPGGVALKIRIGVHTGEARLRSGNYMGLAVHLASRVQSAAHGGQILVSGATRDALSAGAGDLTYVDLGRHRLKDIGTPVYLYQVAGPGLEWTFPAPRTLTAVANNFGSELSSFIGRRDDLAALRKILDQSRLVSLVGAGGVGKTRLAVRLATEVLGFFDGGAWLVDLASLSDASLIAAAALSAVGAPGQPGRPAIDTLTDFLIRRRTLVILDNCEHLLDGCAELVGRLLSACPDVKVLATTREAMNIPGEVLWKVRPLTIPDGDCALDGLQSSEAVVLFTDRTRAVEPDFEITTQNAGAVTQICRRLDGMPLAIELAASRVRSMAVQELSSGLDDRFHLLTGGTRTALPRQRTLEATITWSYDLLSGEERVLFDRLSVFSGGCTTDSARRACSGGAVSEERVLELVGLLVDRSMLVADKNGERKTRYRMFETLRQFGQERLAARGESEAVRKRHLDWAINFAESYPAPTGPGKQEPEIIAEEHNLRSALAWALDAGDEESALRIIGSVWFGHFNERVALYERVLPPSPAVSAALAAKALWAGLALAFMMGDWELGRQRGAWGAAAARVAGDDLRLSLCLSYEGACAWTLGAEEDARRLSEEGVAVAQAAGLPEAEARGLLNVAFVSIDSGDLDRAEQTANRAKALTREVFTQGHIDEALGVIYLARGELAKAAAQLAGTVQEFREIPINCGAHILETCAAWTAAAGRHELGAELLATAERIREETADKPRPNERIIQRDWLPLIAANTEAEAYRSARKRGHLLSFEQALDLAENSLRGYSA